MSPTIAHTRSLDTRMVTDVLHCNRPLFIKIALPSRPSASRLTSPTSIVNYNDGRAERASGTYVCSGANIQPWGLIKLIPKAVRIPGRVRYRSTAITIGIPIAARGSFPRATFAKSPKRLTSKSPTASQYAQRWRRHRPTAAIAHAMHTTHKRISAQFPIPKKAIRARGFRRHIGSRKLPGKSSDTKDRKLAQAPNAKNILRALMPIIRVPDLVTINCDGR